MSEMLALNRGTLRLMRLSSRNGIKKLSCVILYLRFQLSIPVDTHVTEELIVVTLTFVIDLPDTSSALLIPTSGLMRSTPISCFNECVSSASEGAHKASSIDGKAVLALSALVLMEDNTVGFVGLASVFFELCDSFI